MDEKTVICEIVETMEYDTFTTFQDWEIKHRKSLLCRPNGKPSAMLRRKWMWKYSSVSVRHVMNSLNAKPNSSSLSRKTCPAIWRKERIMWKGWSAERQHRLEDYRRSIEQIAKGMENHRPGPKEIFGNDMEAFHRGLWLFLWPKEQGYFFTTFCWTGNMVLKKRLSKSWMQSTLKKLLKKMPIIPFVSWWKNGIQSAMSLSRKR